MSIYNRWGNPVTIVEQISEDQILVRSENGTLFNYSMSELKADGGLEEINNTIKKLPKKG